MSLTRRTPLRRRRALVSRTPCSRRGPVKGQNPVRLARRRKAYAAYLKSPVWKALREKALQRAGHQCEAQVEVWMLDVCWRERCPETGALQCHHLKYPRTLGRETLETLQVLCRRHHELVESGKWWRPRPRGRAA